MNSEFTHSKYVVGIMHLTYYLHAMVICRIMILINKKFASEI